MATTTTSTQTELKRKAAARKGQATRLRNEAKQKRSFGETARTRARAETKALMATSYEAGRAVDASIGAAATIRDAVTGAVRPIGEPGRSASRLREDASRTFGELERRGETQRKRAQGDLSRFGRRTKREAGG
jgi:hypothetical protein